MGHCPFQAGERVIVCEAKTGPIEAKAEPSTCVAMHIFCSGRENILFWHQIALFHQEMLANSHATCIMQEGSAKLLSTANNIPKRHLVAPTNSAAKEMPDA